MSRWILTLLALLLFADAAHATTLEITEGTLLSRALSINVLGDGWLRGDGVTMRVAAFAGYAGPPPTAYQLNLANQNFIWAFVTVGDDFCLLGPGSYGGQPPGDYSSPCGTLTFSSPVPFESGPFSEPYVTAPVPFTLSGHLNVGPGYDVVGQGTLVGLYCIHTVCEGSYASAAALRYTFAVPEPTTLTLLFGGVVALMAVGSATKDRPRLLHISDPPPLRRRPERSWPLAVTWTYRGSRAQGL